MGLPLVGQKTKNNWGHQSKNTWMAQLYPKYLHLLFPWRCYEHGWSVLFRKIHLPWWQFYGSLLKLNGSLACQVISDFSLVSVYYEKQNSYQKSYIFPQVGGKTPARRCQMEILGTQRTSLCSPLWTSPQRCQVLLWWWVEAGEGGCLMSVWFESGWSYGSNPKRKKLKFSGGGEGGGFQGFLARPFALVCRGFHVSVVQSFCCCPFQVFMFVLVVGQVCGSRIFHPFLPAFGKKVKRLGLCPRPMSLGT